MRARPGGSWQRLEGTSKWDLWKGQGSQERLLNWMEARSHGVKIQALDPEGPSSNSGFATY